MEINSDSGDSCSTSSDEEPFNANDNSVTETYGLKYKCPLNALKSFHCISGLPPDFLHDLLEGVVSQDLLGIVRILNVKGWFSIKSYNSILKALKFKASEAGDRPENIPDNKKVKKLVGKAVSNWSHIRSFPLIIRNFDIDENEPALSLSLLLHEIVERLTASSFEEYEIGLLEEKIIEYLDLRSELYGEYPNLLGNPKPKTHNLTHYPEAVSNFGPPITYWTARYESRHRIAKSAAEASKNFKNISHTLSSRQQQRQSSVFYCGMFAVNDIVIKDKAMFVSDFRGDTELERFLVPLMDSDDYICKEVEYRSQVYTAGDLVVLEALSPDKIKVGLVYTTLIKMDSVGLIVKEYLAVRTWLRYFKGVPVGPNFVMVGAQDLADYKPLFNNGTALLPIFCLHHHISVSYE